MTVKRKPSRLIAEPLRGRMEQVQKKRLAKLTAEGYLESRQEVSVLTAEFEAADLENWDEY